MTCMKVLLELGANAALLNGTAGPQAIHRAAASGMCKASPLCSSLSWLCLWLHATHASSSGLPFCRQHRRGRAAARAWR